ncbi:MAG: TIGR00730 family Rossman fold protein [Acidobacteriia bacterium]|nr:TIGR00730 family Rossman fold protein [Terriglobia bacterium]MBV8905326.1 TIGR00730 family Rossman fold protein [Terriglobia bacterium]MBV9744917.1 TIGR00730 family Rossman fold protein [Terriglobia bacterium]
MPSIRSVCVYCASSERTSVIYHDAASRLGRHLAGEGLAVVYGGGRSGSMGRVAGAALAAGGQVTGVMPRFMTDLEWCHTSLTKLHIVDDMHQRKRLMLDLADAVVALPGGCGTLEELFEVISWKRLGLFLGPIVIVNVNGFYEPCLELLERTITEGFMDTKHGIMWSVVTEPEEVAAAIRCAVPWPTEARSFAVLR